MSADDLSEFSMLELFRLESESQVQVLISSLLELERDPTAAGPLAACMRAAHSIKGAARIVGLPIGVSVAHSMEDCFVAAQHAQITLHKRHIDLLLRGVLRLSPGFHCAHSQARSRKNPDGGRAPAFSF